MKRTKKNYTHSILIFNVESDNYPAYIEKVSMNTENNVIKSSGFWSEHSGDGNFFHREWDSHIQRKMTEVHGTKMEIVLDKGQEANRYWYNI